MNIENKINRLIEHYYNNDPAEVFAAIDKAIRMISAEDVSEMMEIEPERVRNVLYDLYLVRDVFS